ncbi:metallophosphoesterase [Hugenholtzia roseola]|uniref:metallophosphoesterase n=1 Tax=Hugenholtzia roseola TaxID=1002 RepID=UPI0004028CCD|nr:metallophosphoesterase [Hugenholtzia roseola]
MNRTLILLLILSLLGFLDWYAFQSIKTLTAASSELTRRISTYVYWTISASAIASMLIYSFVPNAPHSLRQMLVSWAFMIYIAKFFGLFFVLLDDLIRAVKWVYFRFFTPESAPISEENTITRSEFLAKTALVAMATPVGAMTWGILSGAHDYRIRRRTVVLPHLPKAFDGLRLVQISDIHSGSFFNKTAVKGGIEMILNEKPDLICFTGDLVNNIAPEMRDYQDLFSRLKADLGVFSVLGNHDYGDYYRWDSKAEKAKNLQDLIQTHKNMGWNLLQDQHHIFTQNGEKLALIGVQNWGTGGFARYGNLEKAYQGSQEAATKILLSHDPSHWDAQVNGTKANLTENLTFFEAQNIQKRQFKDIDLTLSGHTHGMQFGIETPFFRWSPVQYRYEQWADLYQKENQYLYVNRGFGYIGYPGRIGMPPEITVLELKRA